MALWKISVKNSTNIPCVNKRQRLEKGMYVETSTMSTTPPLNLVKEHAMLAQLFKSNFGIEVDPNKMNGSYFTCERVK